MPSVANNPLSQRLAGMEQFWLAFRRLPDARLCRWLFKPEEAWVLDVFLRDQSGPDAVSNDIFVALHTPVLHWHTYFDQVLDEFTDLIRHDAALLAERGVSIALREEPLRSHHDPMTRFVQTVNQFVRGLRAHTDGVFVLCLLPRTIVSNTTLNQMLTALLQAGLSGDVRILISETIGAERLDTLPGRFRSEVYSYPIDLQLHKVTRQVAALGAPTASDVKFRQWHAELTQALAQRNLREVLYFAGNCLLICQQEQWALLEGSVQLSVAHAYADHRHLEEALGRFLQIIDQMENRFQNGDHSAGRLSIMAWLGAGGVYETLRQRRQAIDSYRLASERSEALAEWLLGIESHRRLAHLLASQPRLSDGHYLRLFELASQLPADQRKTAQLPALGRTYWEQQATPEKKIRAEERLTELLGAEWRKG